MTLSFAAVFMTTLATVLGSLKSSLLLQPRLATRTFHSTWRRAEQFLNANEQTFARVVMNTAAKDKVILVDFYADWCNPCRQLSPILERLTKDTSVKTGSGSSLHLVTVDTDQNIGLAQKYQIRSLPTVIAFKEGRPVDKFIGALPEAGVLRFLEQV